MEAQYKTTNGRLLIKVDAETPKELFKRIAGVQEVFEAEHECGCCHSKDIQFRVRTVEENDFYELKCCDCGARFQYGQNKKGGGLFPKRRDEAGAFLQNNGWAKYQAATAATAATASVSAPLAPVPSLDLPLTPPPAKTNSRVNRADRAS